MKITNKNKIENIIINFIAKGSLKSTNLLKKVQEKTLCTKQGFYKALRVLKDKEIIIVHSKKISLSFIWVKKQVDFYNTILYKYENINTPGQDFLLIEDKDSISYKFKNADTADIFWIHILSILNQKINKSEPLCIYNPHEWFLLVRTESEKTLFANVKNKRKLTILIDNNTILDNFTKKYSNLNNGYYVSDKKIFKKNNCYLNVIGDYCIEVWLDKKTSNLIDNFYNKKNIFNEETKTEL